MELGIGPICRKALESIEVNEKEYETSTKVNPDSILVQDRFRKNLGDLLPLMTSIAKVGLLQPIVVTKKNRLVAGQRRLSAWKLLQGNKPIPVTVIPEYITDAEIEENTVRQDFTVSELAAIYKHYKPQIAEQNPVGNPHGNCGKFPQG